jgi:uncharacterized protein (TIGR00251 family)
MIINVKIKPSSRESKIEQKDGAYIAYVKASPEDNKANIELIKLLKKYFSKDVRIVRGAKSKNKVVEVKNHDN